VRALLNHVGALAGLAVVVILLAALTVQRPAAEPGVRGTPAG
jgi:hypothetical protein